MKFYEWIRSLFEHNEALKSLVKNGGGNFKEVVSLCAAAITVYVGVCALFLVIYLIKISVGTFQYKHDPEKYKKPKYFTLTPIYLLIPVIIIYVFFQTLFAGKINEDVIKNLPTAPYIGIVLLNMWLTASAVTKFDPKALLKLIEKKTAYGVTLNTYAWMVGTITILIVAIEVLRLIIRIIKKIRSIKKGDPDASGPIITGNIKVSIIIVEIVVSLMIFSRIITNYSISYKDNSGQVKAIFIFIGVIVGVVVIKSIITKILKIMLDKIMNKMYIVRDK